MAERLHPSLPPGYDPFKPGWRKYACPRAVEGCGGHLNEETIGDGVRVSCTDLDCRWFLSLKRPTADAPERGVIVVPDAFVQRVDRNAKRNANHWRYSLPGPHAPKKKGPEVPPRERQPQPVLYTHCQVKGCDRKVVLARGLCSSCYSRWTTRGKPEVSAFYLIAKVHRVGNTKPTPAEEAAAQPAPPPPARAAAPSPSIEPLPEKGKDTFILTPFGLVRLTMIGDYLTFFDTRGLLLKQLPMSELRSA